MNFTKLLNLLDSHTLDPNKAAIKTEMINVLKLNTSADLNYELWSKISVHNVMLYLSQF